MSPLEHRDVLRRAETMKLFERNGKIHFGTWRKWWGSSNQEAEKILKDFQNNCAYPRPD